MQRRRQRRGEVGLSPAALGPQTSRAPITVCVSLVSGSVKANVPAGIVGVVSGAAEPVVASCSADLRTWSAGHHHGMIDAEDRDGDVLRGSLRRGLST